MGHSKTTGHSESVMPKNKPGYLEPSLRDILNEHVVVLQCQPIMHSYAHRSHAFWDALKQAKSLMKTSMKANATGGTVVHVLLFVLTGPMRSGMH